MIPIGDDSHVVAQVVGREASVLNSVSIAIFDCRVDAGDAPEALPENDVFAVVFVTRDLLDRGTWPVVRNQEVTIPAAWLPYEDRRASGFIGAKVIGSGIVQHFVRAYFGVEAWDQYKDPGYFDKLLLTPDKRPARVRLKSDELSD